MPVTQQKRQTELDLLRIIATLAVISVHCTGMGTDELSMSDINAKILLIFDCVVTWQVPTFVLISGRFFLDPQKEMPASKLIKSIRRLILAFVSWNVVYQVYYILSGGYNGLNWKGILSQAIIGPYHFWFLIMLICLYAITPFLRNITKSKRQMEYFIVLFFVFSFWTSYGTQIPVIGNILSDILTKTNFHFALGYSGYFVMGYYLNKYPVSDRVEKILYVLAAICLIGVCFLSVRKAMIEGVNNEWYVGYLKPNIIIEAASIYTLFIKRISKHCFSEKSVECIEKLSRYSFGVYLVHALVIDIFSITGLTAVTLNPLIMQPILILLTFAVSNAIVWAFRKIPCIGKAIT